MRSDAQVLVVVDEESSRRRLARDLRARGLSVVEAAGPVHALRALEEGLSPRVVVADTTLAGSDGVALLAEVRRRWPQIRRVLMTGFTEPAAMVRAIKEAHVHRFLTKPWSVELLALVVEEALSDYDVVDRLTALTDDLERQVAERSEMLMQAKAEWLRTVDAIQDPLTLMTPDFVIQRANIVLTEQTGIPIQRIVGRRCWETVVVGSGPCAGCPVPDCLSTGQRSEGEVTDPGTAAVYRVLAYPVPGERGEIDRVVCTYRDVTEERALEAQLVHSEKMAAVGILAGGVAHEINNPLAGMLVWTQMLKREKAEGTEERGWLAEIEDSALRCKKIVQSLLDYSRKVPTQERTTVDLNQVVDRALFLVEATYTKRGASITRSLDPTLQRVDANSNQLQQVVINLVSNAFAALDPGGTIVVRTRNDGTRVALEVQDDGRGIPEGDRERVFVPFFTTKAQGEGTGLGLAVTYGIVQAHQGVISFESEVGVGTTFRVTLPAVRRARSGEIPLP